MDQQEPPLTLEQTLALQGIIDAVISPNASLFRRPQQHHQAARWSHQQRQQPPQRLVLLVEVSASGVATYNPPNS